MLSLKLAPALKAPGIYTYFHPRGGFNLKRLLCNKSLVWPHCRYRLSQVLAELTTTIKNCSVHQAFPARNTIELSRKCENLPHVLLPKSAHDLEKGGAHNHLAIVDRDVRIDIHPADILLAVQRADVRADTDDLDVVLLLSASTAIKLPRKSLGCKK